MSTENASFDAIPSQGKPLAVVIRMTPFAPNWPASNVRTQVEKAFPGVPVITVDQGTDVEVIHAVE
ncbi:hypothetical protein FA743_00840 [Paracoccus gahaiensis]|uniref:Uncharacterized protein n=1 Tax=Paracoccus gahaiensis TaxID=1706839 RepID=A0A4U0RZP5_9RHOB|nr:hypothetical protein [Paracoccus gahaiensis]TJZ93854.1 hypothetical protein FA743_00840 [Paracoccus gahaiensis]